MAQRVEEIQRVRRNIQDNGDQTVTTQATVRDETTKNDRKDDRYEEEYYDVGENLDATESGLNTASGVLALALIALAVWLIWNVLR